MPVLPNLVERFLAKRGTIPPLLLDVAVPIFQIGAMSAAMELGILERLDDRPADLESLARDTGCSERGLRNLLDVLVPLGYVEEDGGEYRLSRIASDRVPIEHLEAMVPFFRAQVEMHLDAAEGVRDAPEEGIFGWEPVRSGEVGRGYQAAMRWLGSETVDEVVGKVRLSPPPRRMLDVGGAHGL